MRGITRSLSCPVWMKCPCIFVCRGCETSQKLVSILSAAIASEKWAGTISVTSRGWYSCQVLWKFFIWLKCWGTINPPSSCYCKFAYIELKWSEIFILIIFVNSVCSWRFILCRSYHGQVYYRNTNNEFYYFYICFVASCYVFFQFINKLNATKLAFVFILLSHYMFRLHGGHHQVL
jgi:hypothetical protein